MSINLKPGYQKALDEIGCKVHHRDNVKPVLDKDDKPTGKTTSLIVAEVTTQTGTVLASAEHASAETAVHKAIETAAANRNVVISGGDAKNVDPKQVADLKATVEEQGKQIKMLLEIANNKNGSGDKFDFASLGVSKLREYATEAGIEGDVAAMKKPELVTALEASGWTPK